MLNKRETYFHIFCVFAQMEEVAIKKTLTVWLCAKTYFTPHDMIDDIVVTVSHIKVMRNFMFCHTKREMFSLHWPELQSRFLPFHLNPPMSYLWCHPRATDGTEPSYSQERLMQCSLRKEFTEDLSVFCSWKSTRLQPHFELLLLDGIGNKI